jgi:hypothetical protein
MKELNTIGPLDLSVCLNPELKVVVQRLLSFFSQGGFKNNYDPIYSAFPRIVSGDRPEAEILDSVRAAAVRRGMDGGWASNLEAVAEGLCGFFRNSRSKWFPLGVPILKVGEVDVALSVGGYARKDLTAKSACLGVVILRSSYPGRTPMAEAIRNLASIIHHTQQRRLRDHLFGAASHRMPKVELLIRHESGSKIEFERLSGSALELMTEDELERLLTVFLDALDQLGSRRLSVLKAKYGPKRPPKSPSSPTLFDL